MNARRGLALVLGLATPLALLAGGPKPQELPSMSPEKWRADVDYLARELPAKHANAFHAVSRDTFQKAIEDLRARSATASDDEMIVGIARIAAIIGDAHTNSGLPVGVHRVPIVVLLLGNEYRIGRASEEAKALLGGRIIRIDDTPIAEVEARLRTVISRDESEPFVRGILPTKLVVGEILHGLKITSDASHARVTVALPDGEKTFDLATVPGATSPADWPCACHDVPLSRQHGSDPTFVTYVETAKTIYFNFRRYDDLDAHARALWKLVDERHPEKLVIDLRQNGGGDYKVGRKYLVNELKRRPTLKAYVLVGNRTYSAAMNNAVDFRTETHATLVGEPIGEKPNSYQESDQMTLPRSKIIVSYSTRFYKFVPDDAPPIVTPDKVIESTWDDFIAGRDPALDWALAQ